MTDNRVLLSSKEMPTKWYNIIPDLPKPPYPYLHPGTLKPLGPADLAPLFPMALIEQEVSTQRWIDIPEEILEILSIWRPTPLVRARNLEKALGTPAKIYFKNESVSPAGSHKPNTAIAQAYYNKKEGVKRLSTETGAGQWGSALAFATCKLGLKCTIYMVKVSYEQKPYRKMLMHTWGAEVFPSPTNKTHSGQEILKNDPNCLGSLGIAISEAVEDAATHDDTKYSLGSVLNHVLMHQTVVGLEAIKQMEKVGDYPDIVIGCVGGGSNYGGLFLPFIPDRLSGKKKTRFIAVEPTACPTITKGKYAYDFGDTAKTAPVAMMHTLGHGFIPAGIHAGGLRYHGMAPLVSLLVDENIVEGAAVHQLGMFEAAVMFARTEGTIPAPETGHAIRVAIDEALKCKETGEAKTILFNFSGHGHFDMAAYENYFEGKLQNFELPNANIEKALKDLPKVPA